MDHPQRGANTEASNASSETSSLMPNVLFREIHKNAFLKRHSSDRRTGFPRKSEKVWVVFCVHDDVEPFLEIYPDQKVALTHKPEWFASLSNVLHVSPTICGHEDEFEFAVTLSFQVVRLSAPTWESMMEWVETIRNKLRELKVLCPKENIYSKMPEQKQPLLPTRDPNSPLPLPPEGPSTLLPGVELVHLETRNNPTSSDNNENSRPQRNAHSRSNINHERRAIKKRVNLPERSVPEASHLAESSDTSNVENHQEVIVVEGASSSAQQNKIRPQRTSVSQPRPSTSGSNITVIEVSTSSVETNILPKHSSSKFEAVSDNEDTDEDVFLISSVNQKVVEKNCGININEEEAHYEHVFLPSVPIAKTQMLQSAQNKPSVISCIPVDGNKSKKTHSTSLLICPNNSNQLNSSQSENIAGTSSINLVKNYNNNEVVLSSSACVNVSGNQDADVPETSDANGPLSPQIQSKLEKVNISGLIPRVPAKSSKPGGLKPVANCLREVNVDGKRSSSDGGSQHASEEPGVSKVTNGESSRTNAVGALPVPAYSQVMKVHKVKMKSDEDKKGSPVLSRRKMPEIQVVEVESQGNKKPECLPVSSANKNQTNMPESKTPNNINHSQKVIANRKQDLGGVSNSEYRNAEVSSSCPSTSGNRVDNGTRINLTKKDSFSYCNNNPEIEPITATVQPAVGVISVEDIPLIGGHQRRRRRSSSSDATPATNAPSSRGIGGADRIRINIPTARDAHRNEAEPRSTSHARTGAEHNSQMPPQSSRLTLREQQVLQLKKEMLHPGGVRLQLRRKDCTGSIALVDVLNGVWVAGWKQKEHPLLYNALHIGDQLISVGDVLVRSSAEAQKLIRTSTSLYIEFIIRRVPFGNVFALQRTAEGQNLGIVQEGNTAEIKDVVPNSIAARQGLTSKTPSCDGLSLTSWFLTEINGRPLNLFFKDNEVRDRLNAVGKEISILVQPHDFVKQIKKQLKNIRSYKDYIVQ